MKYTRYIAALALSLAVAAVVSLLCAQNVSVLAGGLNHPNKIETAAGNSLIVSEAGTMLPHTGRLSVVGRSSVSRKTLISAKKFVS